jgi:hypothetical protein
MQAVFAQFGRLIAAFLLGACLPEPAIAQACKPDGPTLVCDHGGNRYRIIERTTSASKRFAIAWLPSKPTDESTFDSDDDGAKGNIGEDCENFIIRLSDGVPLRQTPGTHWGDRERYNHRQKIAVWSPEETWLLEIDDSKWSTDVAQVYRLGKDGSPRAGFSLLAPLRKAALAYLAKRKTRIAASEFVDSVQADAIGDDGTLTLTFIMQVPKKQSYEFEAKVAVAPKGDAATIRIVSMNYDPGDID